MITEIIQIIEKKIQKMIFAAKKSFLHNKYFQHETFPGPTEKAFLHKISSYTKTFPA